MVQTCTIHTCVEVDAGDRHAAPPLPTQANLHADRPRVSSTAHYVPAACTLGNKAYKYCLYLQILSCIPSMGRTDTSVRLTGAPCPCLQVPDGAGGSTFRSVHMQLLSTTLVAHMLHVAIPQLLPSVDGTPHCGCLMNADTAGVNPSPSLSSF